MELWGVLLTGTVVHGLAGPGFVGKIREEDCRFDSKLIDQQMQYFFFGGRFTVFFVILRS